MWIERTIWITVTLSLATLCVVVWVLAQDSFKNNGRKMVQEARTVAAIAHYIEKGDNQQALDIANTFIDHYQSFFERSNLKAHGLPATRLPKEDLITLIRSEEAIAGNSYFRDTICDSSTYGRSVCQTLSDRQAAE